MKNLLFALFSLAMFFSAAGIYAQNDGGMNGKQGKGEMHKGQGSMQGWFNASVLKEVGVSESVIKQIRELAFQSRKDMMDNQFQIREKKIVLHKEYLKATLDEEKINSLNQEIWTLQKNQYLKIENSRLVIAKLLTPEQREKLYKLIYERKKEFWGGMRYQDN